MSTCKPDRQRPRHEALQAKAHTRAESDTEDSADTSTSSHQEASEESCPTSKIPAYPFPADFRLDFERSSIDVIRQNCRQHPRGTKAIVILLPGVHGGVGPCRQPGETYDEHCLYAKLCARLKELDAPTDVFRCSWPFMRPDMQDAVAGVCHVLHCGLLSAKVAGCKSKRKVRVILVGHSLGGAVAVNSARYFCQQFGPEGHGCRNVESLEHATVQIAGLCTLNGAVSISSLMQGRLGALKNLKALVVSGDADEVVTPEASVGLHQVLSHPSILGDAARHLSLPGGTHDLFQYKDRLVDELSDFISKCLSKRTSSGPIQ